MKTNKKSIKQSCSAASNSTLTIRALADQFGQDIIGATFSSTNPVTHLQYPVGYRRFRARILCELVSFATALPAGAMTAERAAAFLEQVNASYRNQTGRGYSLHTMLKIAAAAGSMFTYGLERGLCLYNPFWVQVTRMSLSLRKVRSRR